LLHWWQGHQQSGVQPCKAQGKSAAKWDLQQCILQDYVSPYVQCSASTKQQLFLTADTVLDALAQLMATLTLTTTCLPHIPGTPAGHHH
jgi:hypothetical protein